jgi:hypothetical protein
MVDSRVSAGDGCIVHREEMKQPGARGESCFGEGQDAPPGHMPREGAPKELADCLVIAREPHLQI